MSKAFAAGIMSQGATGTQLSASGVLPFVASGIEQWGVVARELIHAGVRDAFGGRDAFAVSNPIRNVVSDTDYASIVASMRDESKPTRVVMLQLGDGSWIFCGRVK